MNLADLKIEISNPIPKGGQHVGLIPTGVVITHLPTGLKASCESLRSQRCNRDVALAMIEAGIAKLEAER